MMSGSSWSKLPYEFVDALPIISSLAEMKVVTYVIRHTWGIRDAENIGISHVSKDEFMAGRHDANGKVLDYGVGMSPMSVHSGLKSAIEHGFLVKYVDNQDGGRISCYYRLRYRGDVGDVIYAVDPSTKDRGVWAKIDKEILRDVYARFDGRCAYCLSELSEWHYDHIYPKSRGGPDEFGNLALSCPKCNQSKHDKTPDEWGRPVIFRDQSGESVEYQGWRKYSPSEVLS